MATQGVHGVKVWCGKEPISQDNVSHNVHEQTSWERGEARKMLLEINSLLELGAAVKLPHRTDSTVISRLHGEPPTVLSL